MFAVIRKFFSFGYAISRYTCASVSNPLIASNEWPKATTNIAELMLGQNVPWSHPSECSFSVRFAWVGIGGSGAPPRTTNVITDHTIKITTITVVICMIRNAWPLDS